MNHSAEAKLNELRAKTNRQLASLIGNKLDRGLAFARALDGESVDLAERAFGEANAWMTLLRGATQLERRRLESKLAQLRSALDRARACQLHMHAVC